MNIENIVNPRGPYRFSFLREIVWRWPMDVCKEKHKQIDEKFERHERRINNHSERIDKLEQFRSSTETEMKNLIEQIKSLVSTIKWMMTSTIIVLVGFFIWYIQNLGR